MRVRTVTFDDLGENSEFYIAKNMKFSNIGPFNLYLAGSKFKVTHIAKDEQGNLDVLVVDEEGQERYNFQVEALFQSVPLYEKCSWQR